MSDSNEVRSAVRVLSVIDEIVRGLGEVLGAFGNWIDERVGGRRPIPVPIPVDDERESSSRKCG